MQNDNGIFEKKHVAALLFSLCLVAAAAFTTVYTLSQVERDTEEEQVTEMARENQITDANAAKRAQEEKKANERGLVGMDKGKKLSGEDEAAGVASIGVKAEIEGAEEKTAESETRAAGAESESDAPTELIGEKEEGTAVASLGVQAISPTVNFTENSSLDWPVAGNVVLDYSMDGSIYFPTLQVYKYNPALVIGAEEGSSVVCAAKGIVDFVGTDNETGMTISMNIGNGYELTYGQLKDVAVSQGDIVEEGSLLGYIAKPTKYYCEEGSNLYFKLTRDGDPVDPFLFLE